MNTVEKIQSLIDKANETTGNSDTDLTTATLSLVDGYGQGGDTTNVNLYAPIKYANLNIANNRYLSTFENPFSATNINKNWEIVIIGTPPDTNERPLVSFSRVVNSGIDYVLEISSKNNNLYLYTHSGGLETIDETLNAPLLANDELKIIKNDTSINFYINNVLVKTLAILDSTGSNMTNLFFGYYYGGGGAYYYNGTLTKAKFRYI